MSPLDAALWALAGAASIEALEVFWLIRRSKTPAWPWRRGELGPNLLAMGLRFGLASVLGAVMSEQFNGKMAAFIVGLTAPLIIQQIMDRANAANATLVEKPAEEVGQ